MMRAIFAVTAMLMSIAACSTVQQNEVVSCAAALAATGKTDVQGLLLVAKSTPACQGLGIEITMALVERIGK